MAGGDNHCLAAGLDYPGIGPEHSYLKDLGRVRYEAVTDDEVLAVAVAGETREAVFPALVQTVDRLKSEAARKREYPA